MKESQSETTAAVSLSENIVASPFLKAREVEAGLIFSPGNNIFTVTSSDHTRNPKPQHAFSAQQSLKRLRDDESNATTNKSSLQGNGCSEQESPAQLPLKRHRDDNGEASTTRSPRRGVKSRKQLFASVTASKYEKSASALSQHQFSVMDSLRIGTDLGVKPLESANAPEKPLSLSSHNKWRNALRSAVTEKNRRLEKRLKQSRKKVAALRKQLSRVKKRECTNFAANPKADSSTAFRPVMRGLLDAQVKLSQCKKKGMRWSNQMKDFALSVLYHGPRAYRFLRTVIPLPLIVTNKPFVASQAFMIMLQYTFQKMFQNGKLPKSYVV
nr:PREDICTED: uncharacterized protein LOC109038575 [Bemisia tabaci]